MTTRGWRVRPDLVVLLVLALVLGGCSSEKRYEVLSFFFDGVPDPNQPADTPGGQRLVTRSASGTTFFVHRPFMDGDCSACHLGEFTAFVTRDTVPADVCMACHTQVLDQHPVMHGPVAAMACGQCHNPHRSTAPHLLRAEPRDLCLQCHSQDELGHTVVAHHDGQTSCITCHSGHGGRDRDLLKPTVVAALNDPEPAAEGRGER
jgi:predicted CXXCH cytochrome family protein